MKNKNKYLILGLLCLAWFVGYLDRVSMSIAIIPITKDFNLSPTQVGLVLSSFFIGYAFMQPIGGWLADKFGSKRILIMAIILWSLFTALTGIAWSFISLIVIRILFGIGEGSFPPASSVAIAEHFPKTERARAKTLLLSSTSIGSAVGALVVAAVVTSYGWRSMFIFLGFIGVVISILFWLYVRPSTQERENSKKQTANKVSVKQLLKIPTMQKLVIIFFGITIAGWGLNSWMPSYFVNVRHMDLISAGLSTAIAPLMGFVTSIASGWILDKFMVGREKYLIIIGASLAALFLYLMFNTPSVVLAVTYMTLCKMSMNLVESTVFVLPLKNLPEEFIGTGTGLINFGGQIGSTISPTVIGFLISMFNGSYNAAFWFLIALLTLSTIVGITLRSDKKSLESIKDKATA
ncbi:MFS transporter [Aneurinibacillus migulanus]|uniref:Sugar phosphate permease n=1 Tax=Aneurinibacillus migulanus TaxID=47500 RepID=A0A1G8Y0M8_ANEMI|nr:MFS transporter [Aneurinibacillus migulanus]SDJ96358.1 Sugar phosphate permease [Aneurinibacillus migulanus]